MLVAFSGKIRLMKGALWDLVIFLRLNNSKMKSNN